MVYIGWQYGGNVALLSLFVAPISLILPIVNGMIHPILQPKRILWAYTVVKFAFISTFLEIFLEYFGKYFLEREPSHILFEGLLTLSHGRSLLYMTAGFAKLFSGADGTATLVAAGGCLFAIALLSTFVTTRWYVWVVVTFVVAYAVAYPLGMFGTEQIFGTL